MSRISIEVTREEHQKLKALATLQGKSMKEFVLERALGSDPSADEQQALSELESLLDQRLESYRDTGVIGRSSAQEIFKDVLAEA